MTLGAYIPGADNRAAALRWPYMTAADLATEMHIRGLPALAAYVDGRPVNDRDYRRERLQLSAAERTALNSWVQTAGSAAIKRGEAMRDADPDLRRLHKERMRELREKAERTGGFVAETPGEAKAAIVERNPVFDPGAWQDRANLALVAAGAFIVWRLLK